MALERSTVRAAGAAMATLPPGLLVLRDGLALLRGLLRIFTGLIGAFRQLALALLFHFFLLLQFFLALLKLIVWFGQGGALLKVNPACAAILRLAGNLCALKNGPYGFSAGQDRQWLANADPEKGPPPQAAGKAYGFAAGAAGVVGAGAAAAGSFAGSGSAAGFSTISTRRLRSLFSSLSFGAIG